MRARTAQAWGRPPVSVWARLLWLATAVGSLLFLGLACGEVRFVTVAWDPSPDAASYKVYWGRGPGVYQSVRSVTGNSATIGEAVQPPLYVAVTAVDCAGMESEFSEEAVIDLEDGGPPASQVRVVVERADVRGEWSRHLALAVDTRAERYWRLREVVPGGVVAEWAPKPSGPWSVYRMFWCDGVCRIAFEVVK